MPMTRRLFPWLIFCAAALGLRGAALPTEVETVLKSFRAEGAKGWSFVQTTTSRSKNLVERYDPLKPEGTRWTLLQVNGKPPTESETRDYQQKQTRRSGNDTAPDVVKQLDLNSAERLSDDAEHSVYRFHLNAGGTDDTSAKYMRASFTFHKPTASVQRVELVNTEPFSPMMTVTIQEAQTAIDYSLPTGDRPALLERITVRVRGRAMWVKSLDEDMTVVYSDYHYAGKKPSVVTTPESAKVP